jgi:hypothetical protein
MSRSTQTTTQPITDRNHILTFSKYAGMTIEEVLREDKFFLVWLHNNSPMELSAELLDDAMGITDEERAEWLNSLSRFSDGINELEKN